MRTTGQSLCICRHWIDGRIILHEIGRTTARALNVLNSIDVSQFDRGSFRSVGTLQGQLVTLGKRVDTLDPLSTSRRQTRQRFDAGELVRQIVDGRSQQIIRHEIQSES